MSRIDEKSEYNFWRCEIHMYISMKGENGGQNVSIFLTDRDGSLIL